MKPVGIPDLWFRDKLLLTLSNSASISMRLKSLRQNFWLFWINLVHRLTWVVVRAQCHKLPTTKTLLLNIELSLQYENIISWVYTLYIVCYIAKYVFTLSVSLPSPCLFVTTLFFSLLFALPPSLIIIHQKYRISIWRRVMNARTWRHLLIKWISFQTICASHKHEAMRKRKKSIFWFHLWREWKKNPL